MTDRKFRAAGLARLNSISGQYEIGLDSKAGKVAFRATAPARKAYRDAGPGWSRDRDNRSCCAPWDGLYALPPFVIRCGNGVALAGMVGASCRRRVCAILRRGNGPVMATSWSLRSRTHCHSCGKPAELVDSRGKVWCCACATTDQVPGWLGRIPEKSRAA